jgi:hypothetical protein
MHLTWQSWLQGMPLVRKPRTGIAPTPCRMALAQTPCPRRHLGSLLTGWLRGQRHWVAWRLTRQRGSPAKLESAICSRCRAAGSCFRKSPITSHISLALTTRTICHRGVGALFSLPTHSARLVSCCACQWRVSITSMSLFCPTARLHSILHFWPCEQCRKCVTGKALLACSRSHLCRLTPTVPTEANTRCFSLANPPHLLAIQGLERASELVAEGRRLIEVVFDMPQRAVAPGQVCPCPLLPSQVCMSLVLFLHEPGSICRLREHTTIVWIVRRSLCFTARGFA